MQGCQKGFGVDHRFLEALSSMIVRVAVQVLKIWQLDLIETDYARQLEGSFDLVVHLMPAMPAWWLIHQQFISKAPVISSENILSF